MLFAVETEKVQSLLGQLEALLEGDGLAEDGLVEDGLEKIYSALRETITACYNSDDTDIEDLGDIISLMGDFVYRHICRGLSPVYKISEIRKECKKLANKKFREAGIRKFVNWDEARFQFENLKLYDWTDWNDKIKAKIA